MKNLFRVLGSAVAFVLVVLLGATSCSSNNGNNGPIFFTLDVEVTGSGTVSSDLLGIQCEPDCSSDFEEGTVVLLTAVPSPGFEFVGWTGGNCSGTGTCTVTLDSDIQVTANFQIFQIAYSSRVALDGSDAINTNGIYNIWGIDLDGQNAKPLTRLTATDADSFAPDWSPDNQAIVYDSGRSLNGDNAGGPVFNIWMMNADGTQSLPLTKLTASGAGSFNAKWSPDGSKIIFDSQRNLNSAIDGANLNNTSNIWIMNSDGSDPKALTELTASGADSTRATWSPDGTQITFQSRRDLNPASDAANPNDISNIWVMDSDGGNQMPVTSLTALNTSNFNPVFSPDSSQIAYQSNRDLNPANDTPNTNLTSNIWVSDSEGNTAKALTELTADGADSFTPQWSPDGLQIVFQSGAAFDGGNAANTNNTANVWVMDSDGMNAEPLTLLTILNSGAFNPAFSSDGSKVAFDSEGALDGSDAANLNDNGNIFTVNPDGTGIQSLTKNTADKAESFGPIFSK